uniref:Uncharacterized protein n=1 Tax=Arundo donax TaxID=35708 RepID=A0A0A8Z040_ARUDO
MQQFHFLWYGILNFLKLLTDECVE